MPSPFDAIQEAARQAILSHAARFSAGTLSPQQWGREMQLTLARNWQASFRAGLGRAPTKKEEAWLRREYNKHDAFVRNFADDLREGNMTEAQIANRASMYADRLRGLYEAGGAAAHNLVLPFTPGSCHTDCLTNCKCFLTYEERDGKTVAIWNYSPEAQHCGDCPKLNGLPHTEWRQAIGKGGPNSGWYAENGHVPGSQGGGGGEAADSKKLAASGTDMAAHVAQMEKDMPHIQEESMNIFDEGWAAMQEEESRLGRPLTDEESDAIMGPYIQRSDELMDQVTNIDTHVQAYLDRQLTKNPAELSVTHGNRFNDEETAGIEAAQRWVADRIGKGQGLDGVEVNTRPIRASDSTTASGYYTSDGQMFLRRGGSRQDTAGMAVHELGHAWESNNPSVRKAATDFLLKRAGQEEIGRISLWGNDAEGVLDKFSISNGYAGRVYRDDGGRITNTEIVSCGMNLLYTCPRDFAVRDPEYFAFMIDLLRG
jgi:hypothetical protein